MNAPDLLRSMLSSALTGDACADAIPTEGVDTRAEIPAQREHALLQALFQLVPFGLQLVDVRLGRSIAVNPALQRITGYSARELIEGNPLERFPQRWWSERESWFRDAQAKGRFGPSEVEYRHASGRLLHLVFSGVRVEGENADYLWLCVQDVSDFRALEAELRQAACTDRLTGLSNRASFIAELQACLSPAQHTTSRPLAVLFLDFDRFKLVNDTLGHDAGDELLCGIARRLGAALQTLAEGGLVDRWHLARFGGDEFVLMTQPGAAHAGDEAHAMRCAEAILAGLADPFAVKQQSIQSTASIGITMWRPGQADSPETLLRDADTAMYEAKRLGRGRAVVFDDAMRARLTRAVQLEAALRDAIACAQLTVVYQPIVGLETGQVASVEALMRWQHPELGSVSPDEFIAIAEESGHILVMGEWVLHEACRQWAQWQAHDALHAPAMVSVNLSRIQMAHGERLLRAVRDALAASGAPPQALQLEITEREVMKDPRAALELMQALSALGVKLAMDDFGTGTSSLGCLREYPFHTVKIDKSFVTGLTRDPHVLAVAHATVSVIENLGMQSVAEGVEELSEAATLQGLGCHHGQGLLFAPPLPPGELLQALTEMAARWRGQPGHDTGPPGA